MGSSTLSLLGAILVIVSFVPVAFILFGEGAAKEVKKHLSDIAKGDE